MNVTQAQGLAVGLLTVSVQIVLVAMFLVADVLRSLRQREAVREYLVILLLLILLGIVFWAAISLSVSIIHL